MSKQAARCPAIRVMMMPRDTNGHGTIFGGVILSHIDQAGAIGAREYAPHKYVTVAMNGVVFKEPVFVGDVLSFYAEVVRTGRSSITVHVEVSAERFTDPTEVVSVTEATLTYVAIDERRNAIPLNAAGAQRSG